MNKVKLFFKSFICGFICVTALSSCYSTYTEYYTVDDFPAFRNKCIGMTHNQIVTSLGAPQRTESDGNNGSILIYEKSTTTSVSTSVATKENVNIFTGTYTPGVRSAAQQTTTTNYTQYFINSNNICYDVKTNIPMTHQEAGNTYRKKSFWKSFLLGEVIVLGVMCGTLGIIELCL